MAGTSFFNSIPNSMTRNWVLNYLRKPCMLFIKVIMQVGPMFTMIPFKRKKLYPRNMEETERRPEAKIPWTLWLLIRHIWHPMDWSFIPAPCFRKGIGTVHFSHFTDHGTGRRKNKKDISWFSSHLKMVIRLGTGKSSQIISPDQIISVLRDRHCTGPVDLRRDPTVRYMFPTMRKELFIESPMMPDNL